MVPTYQVRGHRKKESSDKRSAFLSKSTNEKVGGADRIGKKVSEMAVGMELAGLDMHGDRFKNKFRRRTKMDIEFNKQLEA